MIRILQIYRGLAALAVVAYHLSGFLADERYLGHKVLEAGTWRMNLGVDFFFVLSGFIMLYAHEQDVGRPEALVSYLKKRFIRIFAPYWVYISVFLILVALGLGEKVALPQNAAQWLNTIFLVQLDDFALPIAPAWTLVREVAFYTVFSMLIFNRRIGFIVFMLWQYFCLLALAHNEAGRRDPLSVYFSGYNFEFSLGMISYALYKYYDLKYSLLAAFAVTFGIIFAIECSGYDFIAYNLFYSISFAFLIAGSAKFDPVIRPVFQKTFGFIGAASYTIYLTHEAVMGVLCKLLMHIDYFVRNGIIFYFAVLTGAVAIGGLMYRFVEQPVTYLARRAVGLNGRLPFALRLWRGRGILPQRNAE